MRSKLFTILTIAAAAATLSLAPAHADVFSSQSFTGETSELQHLPGVNLDGTAGVAGTGNCVDSSTTTSFSPGRSSEPGTLTECQFGKFSISTFSTNGAKPYQFDNTYGGNPPPWNQGWQP